MYLKKIEMQGFKSFADKTVIELMPGITSVIGPNGSGKSNISDAIRWILGEQSMKALRGTKSHDLVFAGTQNRKSLGYAEASLVFDNADGSLPIEFSEVTVTRRVYRSGETEIFINKTPCRLKDVLELFMDTGIGRDGYSIIGQGRIDDILSNKSEDRRHIFEEAAGIVKYRTRKEESERKLERTKLNLLRINDILSEIESNIEPLKNQSEKARKYLDYRQELKDIEIGLFIFNIKKYKEELSKINEDSEIIKQNCEDEQTKFEKYKIQKEELKSAIDEITEKIEKMSNLGFESQKEIEQLNSEINVANTRKSNNEENEERFKKEIEELKEKIESFNSELQVRDEKKNRLKENKEKFVKELSEKEKELEKLTSKLSKKELEIEKKKQKVEKNTDRKYEVQALISTSKANLENYKKQERQIGQEVQNTISELDSSRIKKSEIAKTFQEIDNKHNKLIKQIEAGAKQKEEANKKIEDYEKSIQMYTNDMRIKESRLKFLIETEKEKEGYIRSVKSLLKDCEQIKELGKGMHGVLANIIEVSEEYETAIEMCLGASLQNIVTDSEQDAKRLVEHLRKNKLGRASFLPISSVRGKKLTTIKGKENGVIGIASDLVKYSKKYEQIIISLLGRTVIVDTMENAIKVAKQNSYSFRIITIEGDVINPSGAITGGFVAKKTVNILGRGREIEKLEKEIKALKKKIETTKEKEEEFKKSINHILEASKEQEKELQEMEITYATEKQKMVSIEEEVSKLEKRLEKLKKDKILAGENQEKCVKEEEKFNAEITKINEENEKLNAQIKEFADLNKDDQKYIDNLNEDITNLRISVSSFDESEMSIQEMEERINQDIENAKTSIEHKENEIENLKQSNIDLDKKVEEINKQIEQIRKDVSNSGNKVENLKQERIEENEKLEKLEDEISEVRNVIENLNAQIVKGDAKQSKLEENIQEITDKMWEEYELTPNNVTEYKKPDNVAKTGKRVNELRRKIRDLGSVNVDSIEEYKTLKQRYDFMCEQRLDLESTMAKLRNIVSDMTGIMKKQFKEKFKEINKNFVEVFKELFGGGKAALKLEDENNILECGIEITVQPPGKKLTNMLQLSGGERAFAAIALLFAILKINPSPFCVLDEIEAALDDVNVYRFADYLKNFSKDTQFLVITHRKGTMEAADTVYGVTMEEKGISKLLSIKLKS